MTRQLTLEAAWHWLWSLLNAPAKHLGYTATAVFIGEEQLELTGVVGRGSQGVCYSAVYNGHDVIVKVSIEHADELLSERQVICALRDHPALLTARLGAHEDVAGDCDGGGATDSADHAFVDIEKLAEDLQVHLPELCAACHGVLVMTSTGDPFNNRAWARKLGEAFLPALPHKRIACTCLNRRHGCGHVAASILNISATGAPCFVPSRHDVRARRGKHSACCTPSHCSTHTEHFRHQS